ncbi:MAG TPA: hypothetical protein PLP33_19750, partial [Leptospiraceae bacterium]|nr:hypothetical protein [Leptospiraceae bacterium]
LFSFQASCQGAAHDGPSNRGIAELIANCVPQNKKCPDALGAGEPVAIPNQQFFIYAGIDCARKNRAVARTRVDMRFVF